MAGTPGTPVAFADVSEGSLVQARDNGYWYNAKVIQKTGSGNRAKVKVHFVGFPDNQDMEFRARQGAVRWRLPAAELRAERDCSRWGRIDGRTVDGQWLVEKILQKKRFKRGIKYLVRWAGWDEEYDSWESTVSREIVEEFEEALQLAAKRSAAPKQRRPPFSPTLVAHEAPEVLDFRVAETAVLLADVCGEAIVKVTRVKSALAEACIYKTKPVSAGAFVALRERLRRLAADANADRDLDLAVTNISSLRSGLRPVDTFSVMDNDLVNELVGDGVLTIHVNSGVAVKMVAPLDFFLYARKPTPTDELDIVMQLKVKAHFAAVVPDLSAPGTALFRLDTASFTYPPDDETAYMRAMAKALLARGGVPAVLLAWAQTIPIDD